MTFALVWNDSRRILSMRASVISPYRSGGRSVPQGFLHREVYNHFLIPYSVNLTRYHLRYGLTLSFLPTYFLGQLLRKVPAESPTFLQHWGLRQSQISRRNEKYIPVRYCTVPYDMVRYGALPVRYRQGPFSQSSVLSPQSSVLSPQVSDPVHTGIHA